jgi:hypothetical protein
MNSNLKVKAEKIYKLKRVYKNRERIVEGTLDSLKRYFSYDYEIGESWNSKIKRLSEVKTIVSFVNNLRKAYEAKEACCFERTFIDIVKE